MRLNKGELDWGLIGSRTVALMIVGAQCDRVYWMVEYEMASAYRVCFCRLIE